MVRVHKFAARLVTNNFQQDIPYGQLTKNLGWQPIHHTVAYRRLLNVKKYLEGVRHIAEDVFVLETASSTTCSDRIREREQAHDKQLVIRKS